MKEVEWPDTKGNKESVLWKPGPPSTLSDQLRGSYSGVACGQLKKKKVKFDDLMVKSADTEPVLRGGTALNCYFRSSSDRKRFLSSTSFQRTDYIVFFCDWYPVLFGIDEDDIPSSEDEEGLFDIDWDDLEEKALALTDSELQMMQQGSRGCLSDRELKIAWKRDQVPRYGRRARQKPILERDNYEKFECICDIDTTYSRHYIPRFDGGVEREGEELKTPHFRAFWEDFKEKADLADLDQSSSIFEQTKEEAEEEKKGLRRIIAEYPSSNQKDITRFRQETLARFRPLDCREVRRYRMPYAEAVYLELQEDLYLNSAEFFKYLIIKDHFLNSDAGKTGVRLRPNKPLINKLIIFLKFAEKLNRRKEYHKEAVVLLKSGKYFNDYDENWWWLAEELYTKAVKTSENSVIDGGKAEAIANYILGTFLLDCVHRVQPAQEHLLRARELSLGKDWNAGRILNKVQDPVYQECANYLCRALIASSKELRMAGKPEEALPLIHRSHKLCKESKNPKKEIEMETYFELGMTYQEVGMLDWAKIALRKFIEIAKLEDYPRSICEGYLEMAICFRSEGDLNRCHHYLTTYLKTAEANRNKNLIAFAHRYLGEFYLNSGNAEVALKHFYEAFTSFLEQCEEAREIPFSEWKPEHFTLLQDVELTRALAALAQGEIFTQPLFNLIFKTKNAKNQKEIQLLIDWKNTNKENSPQVCKEILQLASKQRASANVLDSDGSTMRIGGLFEEAEDSYANGRFPARGKDKTDSMQ